MRKKTKMAPCASSDCTRMVTVRSRYEAEYCPACKQQRIRESQRRYEQARREEGGDPRHDPDLSLNKKLEEAEFAVVRDAGREEEAFRPGARLTAREIRHMLEHEALAVNSILVHVRSRREHYVLRDRRGHLILVPVHSASDGGAKNGEAAKGPHFNEPKNNAARRCRARPGRQRFEERRAGSHVRQGGRATKSLSGGSPGLRQQ